MLRRNFRGLLLLALLALGTSCKKENTGTSAAEAAAYSGCEHDTKVNLAFPKTWPYPADDREIRWRGTSMRIGLQMKPHSSAPRTGTTSWKDGEDMKVIDSQVVVRKARRVVAKHDLAVRREVWDQGRKLVQTTLAVKAGGTVDFVLYDSRGSCLIVTEEGLASVACDLDGTFDTVTRDNPYACEEVWWFKVDKARTTRGWFRFDPERMERVSAK